MQRGKILSEEEVDAVVDIVASAVQGLSLTVSPLLIKMVAYLTPAHKTLYHLAQEKNLRLNKNVNKNTWIKLTVFLFLLLV